MRVLCTRWDRLHTYKFCDESIGSRAVSESSEPDTRFSSRQTKPVTWASSPFGMHQSSKCDTTSLCDLPASPSWLPNAHDQRMRNALRAGISNGNDERIRAMLQRLRAGHEIVVTAIGASVTADHGGAVGWMQDKFLLGYSGTPSQCTRQCVKPGWLLPVGDFLWRLQAGRGHSNTPWPGARAPNSSKVLLVNAGNAGHKLDYVSHCLATKVPLETDLFIVDASAVPQEAATVEAALRRLLSLPRAPAILLLNFANFCWHHDQNGELARKEVQSRVCYQPSRLASTWRSSGRMEADIDELAGYYGLPSLSVRRSFFPWAMRAHVDGFFRPWELLGDGLHPMKVGCSARERRAAVPCVRERYYHMIAALVNTYLQGAWERMLRDESEIPIPTTQTPSERLRLAEAAATAATASRAGDGEAMPEGRGVAVGGLPPAAPVVHPAQDADGSVGSPIPCATLYKMPTMWASDVPAIERCFAWRGEDLLPPPEKAPARLLRGSVGWNFTEFDSARAADAKSACAAEAKVREAAAEAEAAAAPAARTGTRPLSAKERTGQPGRVRAPPWSIGICIRQRTSKSRPGLTAFNAGSRARIELTLSANAGVGDELDDASTPHGDFAATERRGHARHAHMPAEAMIAYLSSYEAMGTVAYRCEGGCRCESRTIDAHRGEEEMQRLVSVYKTERIPMQLTTVRRRCVLRLDVLNETRSQGHKFKVSEIALIGYSVAPADAAANRSASPAPGTRTGPVVPRSRSEIQNACNDSGLEALAAPQVAQRGPRRTKPAAVMAAKGGSRG